MTSAKACHDSAYSHVAGESMFIEDLPAIQGELYVGIAGSPVASGKLEKIMTDGVWDIEGVVQVFTAKDFHHNRWGAIVEDQPLLVEDEIAYLGEPIVLIAAETREAATAATKKVEFQITESQPIFSIDDAKRQKLFFQEPLVIQRGDPESALAKAPFVIQGSFYSKGQEHFYLESQSAIAYPGENNEILIHSSTQHPTEVQHVVAHCLGLDFSQVVCTVKRMGGGFGGKESQASHFAALCALVAHKTKRVARLHLTKDEDMAWTGKRHPFKNDFRVGFDHEGRILALEANLYSDGGAYLDLSAPVLQRAMLHCDNAYFLPHVRLEGRICRSNFPPNTAFRGFGGPQGVALIENIMEDIAYHRQLDPLVVRERNLYGAAPRHITPYGQELSNNTLPELFQTIKKKAEYEARRAAIQSFNQKNCGKLKGLAITPVKFGISFTVKHLNQGNALINLHRDGTFQVSTGATEMGQGVNIKIAQIVASVFDLSPRQIKIMPTSTEKNHNTSATAASSGTDINGAAALIAAEKLKKRLAAFASFYLAATEDVQFKIQSLAEEFNQEAHESRDDVSFAKGQVYLSSDPTKVMSFAALAELAYFQRISLGEYGYYRTKGIEYDRVKGRGKPFLYFTNGVAASEVEIDEYTGELKVRRTDIVMDLGRPINDGIDRGQIAGAFVQGLGWVSSEELCYRPDGSLVTHSPTTYKIPNIQDIPREFHIELMENLDHNSSVRGSKAVGEPPFLLAISVWVAVKQALQARLQQEVRDLCLPATNEEILRVLNRRADHGTDRPIL